MHAPDLLYHLNMTLGDTARNQEKEEVMTEEVKAVASMCSTECQICKNEGTAVVDEHGCSSIHSYHQLKVMDRNIPLVLLPISISSQSPLLM